MTDPQTALAWHQSSRTIDQSAWSRNSPLRRKLRRSTASFTAPIFASAPLPRPFATAARASSRWTPTMSNAKSHGEPRRVHEESRAPEIRAEGEAPFGRLERRIELPHLEDADGGVEALGHDREADIAACRALAMRPLDEPLEAFDRRRRRRNEPRHLARREQRRRAARASVSRSSRSRTAAAGQHRQRLPPVALSWPPCPTASHRRRESGHHLRPGAHLASSLYLAAPACPRRCCRRRPRSGCPSTMLATCDCSVPQTMLSSSALSVPHTMLSPSARQRAPRRRCRRPCRTCPRRCCRRRCWRPVPQTMPARSLLIAPTTRSV